MELSLVLCTRNRGALLAQSLAACEGVRFVSPWELVIVDNASTDETPSVIAQFMATTALTVQAVVEPGVGLARARNAGWRKARGEIVAFTDDDCYPARDYVAQLCRCMSDRRLDYLGGKVLLNDPADMPVTIQLRDTSLEIPARSFIPAGLILGANMAARRAVIEQLGGFDELLGSGTAFPSEDVEFLSRASAAGFVGGYDPAPTVSHHHRRKAGTDVERLVRSYDAGRGAYYMACILDPRRRADALRHWYWSARSSHARQTVREVKGALAYFFARMPVMRRK